MRETRRVLPVIVFAILVVLGIGALAAQQNVAHRLRYFPETGRLVREPFLPFYDEQGGVTMFGYPLTNAYTDPDGTLVQTFQNVHLQLTVRGIELAPIGQALHLGEEDASHTVASELSDFYRAHGGEVFFGSPLDSAREENGLLIQDFERVRLVRSRAGEVHLANLGSIFLTAFPPPPESGQAAFRMRGTPAPPLVIHPLISVAEPTVGKDGQQTIYLYVEDDSGAPVVGVQALAILRYGDAAAEVALPDTDQQGLAVATFIAPPASPGSQVIVEMHVLFGEVFMTVQTTYFQWW